MTSRLAVVFFNFLYMLLKYSFWGGVDGHGPREPSNTQSYWYVYERRLGGAGYLLGKAVC